MSKPRRSVRKDENTIFDYTYHRIFLQFQSKHQDPKIDDSKYYDNCYELQSHYERTVKGDERTQEILRAKDPPHIYRCTPPELCPLEMRRQRIAGSLQPPEPLKITDPVRTAGQPLPLELIRMILLHLDSATLISFSQACRLFRATVNPDRFHFLQRLLTHELDPMLGGEIPIVQPHDNSKPLVSPRYSQTLRWSRVKYACSGCLRLRHNRWFDNHAILGLQYRKPPVGHPAADIIAEPGDERERWHRRRAKVAEGQEPLGMARWASHKTMVKKWRKMHALSAWMPIADAAHRELLEEELCGYQRHRRICIECRYVRNESKPKRKAEWDIDHVGHDDLKYLSPWRPFQRSTRVITYNENPIFASRPEYIGEPVNRGVMHRDFGGKTTPQYRILCKICEHFKDLASFRREIDARMYFRRWNIMRYDWEHRLPEHNQFFSDWICTSCLIGGDTGRVVESLRQGPTMDVRRYVALAREYYSLVEPQHRRIVIQQMLAGLALADGRLLHSSLSIRDIGKRVGINGLGGIGARVGENFIDAFARVIFRTRLTRQKEARRRRFEKDFPHEVRMEELESLDSLDFDILEV